MVEGFSLHADTHVHENDRAGLAKLCRYGSRGAVAEERLSRLEDGRYAYRTKRGPTLVLTAGDLVRRLLALIPPRGQHLTCFHGLFAPNAKLRGTLMKAPAKLRQVSAQIEHFGKREAEAIAQATASGLGHPSETYVRERRLGVPLRRKAGESLASSHPAPSLS